MTIGILETLHAELVTITHDARGLEVRRGPDGQYPRGVRITVINGATRGETRVSEARFTIPLAQAADLGRKLVAWGEGDRPDLYVAPFVAAALHFEP